MSVQDTPVKPRWKRRLRRVAIWLIGLALVAVVAVAVWGYVEARHLREEIDKIKAAGEPLTLKDLDAWLPKVNEADDAGPYYEAAMALLRDKDAQKLWDDYDGYTRAFHKSPASQPSREAGEGVDRLLADNALTLQMLDLAAQRPACRFRIGIEAGMEHCINRLSRARAVARLLSLQATVRSCSNRPDEAVDSIICLLRMLRMFEPQPVVTAHLVKVAVASLACLDAKTVLETGHPADAKLALLQQMLLAVDVPSSLQRAVLAERAYGIELMGQMPGIGGTMAMGVPCDAGTGLPERWLSGSSWVWDPIPRHLAAGYLRDMATLLRNVRRPLPEMLIATQDEAEMKSIFGRMIGASLARMFVLTVRGESVSRCTAVAIMVERYRRATGHPPQSLHDLVPTYAPTLPNDPFTSSDLRYRHDEKAYVVYSVGEDQKDDNGEVDADEKGEQARDDGIRIRLAAAR